MKKKIDEDWEELKRRLAPYEREVTKVLARRNKKWHELLAEYKKKKKEDAE